MKRVMALQQMIGKKKSGFHFFRLFCPVILPGTNFDCVAFEDYPGWGKICKIVSNHPHF